MQSYICKKWKESFYVLFCGQMRGYPFIHPTQHACCGMRRGTGANATNLGDPQATMTINMGSVQSSPTPALPGEWCGAWVTNPTPSYAAGTIAVYAKFTKNVNGNPAGIGEATATAQVLWTPSDSDTYTATTTSDGLCCLSRLRC